MLSCFEPEHQSDARPVWVVASARYEGWLAGQPERVRAWLEGSGFEAKGGCSAVIPATDGTPEMGLLTISDPPEPWDFAALREQLPGGSWYLKSAGDRFDEGHAVLGWALASYRFDRYRTDDQKKELRLVVESRPEVLRANAIAKAIYLARDLINTPASDLGPAELAEAATSLSKRFGVEINIVHGENLLQNNYPGIWAVGQASTRSPRMIDMRWGDPDKPTVTLVGKGVCFDTGGLNLKPLSGMLLMKKDMGGAAIVIALAQLIMELSIPVRLRVLIAAVENSVAGNSYRPGDVIRTRNGSTIEIANTDAEGRVILADLLAEADAESPDVLIDIATLTGSARVALGFEIAGVFASRDRAALELLRLSRTAFDPVWPLPLYSPYYNLLASDVADIMTVGPPGIAGAILAALFLRTFVRQTNNWVHFDISAWNDKARPGRPRGGEATGLRTVLAWIEHHSACHHHPPSQR